MTKIKGASYKKFLGLVGLQQKNRQPITLMKSSSTLICRLAINRDLAEDITKATKSTKHSIDDRILADVH